MGPFGDEWIAGTYLKNFSFFSFFYIFTTYKNKNLSYISKIVYKFENIKLAKDIWGIDKDDNKYKLFNYKGNRVHTFSLYDMVDKYFFIIFILFFV